MFRPGIYLITLIVQTIFWLGLLLYNYSAYAGNSPDMLQAEIFKVFVENRWALVFAELLLPAIMTVACLFLIFWKLRPNPIRLPYLVLLFMSVEYWIWRTWLFPDRLIRYFEINESGNLAIEPSEPHIYILVGFVLLGILIYRIREYREGPGTPLERDLLRFRRERESEL